VRRPVPRRLAPGEEATLVEHLGELRTRLVISLLSLVVCFAFTYAYHHRLIHWLEQPLPAKRRHLVTFSPAEPFITSFMVAFYASFLLSFPIILWQVWSFLAPAFERHTQRIVAGFTAFASVLMVGGVLFGYFVALPAAVHFLTNYDSSLYNIQIRARDYLGFASLVLLAVGVVFEVPIVVLGLVRLRILTAKKLRGNWRLGIVVMVAVAVALPGVDPVTTSIEAVPLLILYFLSIVLATIFEKRWARHSTIGDAAFEGSDF
jgi:sec-independent protein translocase protein TatC